MTLSYIGNAQWQNLNTSFQNVAYSIHTCNYDIYAGLGGGGVYRSQDDGVTWVAVNNGIQMGGAYVFSLTSRNDSIYAGGFGEVSFTHDRGENWKVLNLNLWLNNNVYALIVKDNYLFAGVGHDASNGVYRKPLNDTVWTQVNNGLPANVAVNAFAMNNNFLFAGTDLGVYVSTNNGTNWTLANNGINAGLTIKSLIAINGNILAGTSDGIFVSSNNGGSWSRPTNGIPPNSQILCFTSYANYVVAGANNTSYFSADNGFSWNNISNGLDSVFYVYSISMNDNNIYASASTPTSLSIFKFPYNSLSVFENNVNKDHAWSISPNPFASQTTLQTDHVFKNATLIIYNLHGQAVKQIDNLSGQSITFRRDNLPNGEYFIRLTQDDKVIVTDKLVIIEN